MRSARGSASSVSAGTSRRWRGGWRLDGWRPYCAIGAVAGLGLLLSACSPRALLTQGVADQLATQGAMPEDDLHLAREAAAFYLKLSESVLRQTPGHLPLAAAVAAGFVQYTYAFVAFEAERLEAHDARAALQLRTRAARLYGRAQRHALAALEADRPGFGRLLAAGTVTLRPEQVPVAYWGAAAWGAAIALSKDRPDAVADLPLAIALARAAVAVDPAHAEGGLAALIGTFEAARPGGSRREAQAWFDAATASAQGRHAAPLVARAEAIAQPDGERAAFEALLRQAIGVATRHPGLNNEVMRTRALWLLETIDDRF